MHYGSLMKLSSEPATRPEPAAWTKSFPWIKLFTFGANGKYLLTVAIILIRALQKNAEPMSTWSAASWVLMTMPVWLPTALGALLFIVWFALWVWANASRRY